MNPSRRNFFWSSLTGMASGLGTALIGRQAAAQEPSSAPPASSAKGYVPVHTLNGVTLPFVMKDGGA